MPAQVAAGRAGSRLRAPLAMSPSVMVFVACVVIPLPPGQLGQRIADRSALALFEGCSVGAVDDDVLDTVAPWGSS
jgi:hypothetical protein